MNEHELEFRRCGDCGEWTTEEDHTYRICFGCMTFETNCSWFEHKTWRSRKWRTYYIDADLSPFIREGHKWDEGVICIVDNLILESLKQVEVHAFDMELLGGS